MTPPKSIFKANDIRGVYGDSLTESGAYDIGLALAKAVLTSGHDSIALGRDGRLSSPSLAEALAQGIANGGVKVWNVGVAPTPALYYAAYTLAGGNGAMITGSHNPPAHNGIKTVVGGKTLGGKNIWEFLPSQKAGAPAQVVNADIRDDYLNAVCQAVLPCRPLRLVVDAGNGAAGEYAPELYQRLGHHITALFCEIDGNFPNHHPDPAQPENLIDARNKMKETNADVALVFDGDGDRLGVLINGDEDWVFADRLLMVLARDMLERNPGARVVFDVKCSRDLAPWIEQCGGVADMQPTGHAFIKSRMRETGALLGGEMSGHFYFAEDWKGFDDALLAGARLAAIFGNMTNPMRDIPKSVASPEIVVDIGEKDGHKLIADMLKLAKFDGAKMITIDGARAEYDDGFGLARASNTTSSLVLRFEGQNDNVIKRIREDFRRALATVGVDWQ